jgi:hypothetical protein
LYAIFRLRLYAFWRDVIYNQYPELALTKAHYVAETKKLCRRMTKDNMKEFKYVVGKATHSNPLVVMDLLLDQVWTRQLTSPNFEMISDFPFCCD